MAEYYNRGGEHTEDLELRTMAGLVASGEAEFDKAVDILARRHGVGEDVTRYVEAWEAVDHAVSMAERAEAGPPLSAGQLALHGLSEPEPVAPKLEGVPLRTLRAHLAGIEAAWESAEAKADYEADVLWTRLSERLKKAVTDVLSGKKPEPQIAVLRHDLHPLVRRGLGLDDGLPLTKDRINGLLSGHRADGGKIEGKRYVKSYERTNARTGEKTDTTPLGAMDFCPAPHKSVSVLWAFAPPVEQAMVFRAHIEAAREAVAYIAEAVGRMRDRNDGEISWIDGHVGWVEFTHHTSRRTATVVKDGAVHFEEKGKITTPGDPELHTHFLIPATVWTEDGRVGGLDTKALTGFIFEADGVYQALLGQKLREAGFAVALDERTGAAKATIIPDYMNELMSKRTNAGEALARLMAAQRGEDWDALSPDQQVARLKIATQDRNQKEQGGKDDVANVADWHRQATAAGWEPPRTFIAPERAVELEHEARIHRAYEIALPHLDEKLQHQSVVKHWDLRCAALRGLVATGYHGLDDVAAVTRLMRDEGVTQYGERTALVWGQEPDKRYVSISTALHEAQETEFVALARSAAADRSQALTPGAIEAAARDSGLDFSRPNGPELLSAAHRVGEGGAVGVVIGVPGSGKSALLKILAPAWQAQGRDVWGASLAWRQADDMVDGGIDRNRLKAFSVLIDGLRDGTIALTPQSVVAVDELGLLGTRQGLELLRERDRIGFSVVMLGDPAQCASVQAGEIIGLCRKALGADAIPDMLITERQKSDREKEIVGLFRDGRPRVALDMKRADGTAEMVPGGYDQAIARVAALYAERLRATGDAPTISTPTNADAHRIGAAVRLELRRMGLIGRDIRTVKATDGERDYNLPLAVGDHVRLFRSTGVRLENGRGGRIGRNGTVAEIVGADDTGITLRSIKTGVVGRAVWDDMSDARGRVRLAYGSALTVHSSQGITSKEHIFAMPAGSQAVTGAVGYTASTRHRLRSFIVTSDMAERKSVRDSRAINDVREIDMDAKWANVARNFIPSPAKDLAINMADRVRELKRGMVRGFQAAMHPAEQRRRNGEAPSHAPELAQRLWADAVLGPEARHVHSLTL